MPYFGEAGLHNPKFRPLINQGCLKTWEPFLFFPALPGEAADEEAIGFKTLYALLYHTHLRGLADPEVLHSKWNDAKRALSQAGLVGASLKGTLMSNLNHGYFLGGKNHQRKQEVLESLAHRLPIEDFIDEIAFDRSLLVDSVMISDESLMRDIADWNTARETLDRGSLATKTDENVGGDDAQNQGGDDDEGDGGGDQQEPDVPPDPANRSEFNTLRGEYKNSWSLCANLYQDKDLQKRLRIIFLCLAPLEQEFYADVKAQEGGQVCLARWAGARALGAWNKCISETLGLLTSADLFQKLGMETSNKVIPEEHRQEPWVQEEFALTKMVFNLVLHVAAARAWSQSMFGIQLPQLCAGMLHEDPDARQRACKLMALFARAVIAAEKDCNWSSSDGTLLEFSWRLYAGPHTTKFILEDQFNHLQHIASAQNKGRAYMAKPSQYFYCATSPILRTAKLPGPEVVYSTFQSCFSDLVAKVREKKGSEIPRTHGASDLYRPSQHPLPEKLGSEAEWMKKQRDWKAAANRVATAATMYLAEDQRCLLKIGEVYHNSLSGSYFLSLGSFNWGCQALKLAKHTVQEQVFFVVEHAVNVRPSWIFNYQVDGNSPWKAIETIPVPPCCNALGTGGASLMRTSSASYDLLAFAVKKGIFLSVPQMKKMYQAREWAYPKGSGPKGVTHRFKKDFARDMIEKLWPLETDESKEEMFIALMGTRASIDKDHDNCDKSLLEVISGLDPENAEAAKGVRKECWDKLAAKRDASQKRPVPEWRGGWQKQNFTPRELRELLPPVSADTTVWIKRLPQQSSYSGYYDRCLDCALFDFVTPAKDEENRLEHPPETVPCIGDSCCIGSTCMNLPGMGCKASRGRTQCVGSSAFAMKEGVCQCLRGPCNEEGICVSTLPPKQQKDFLSPAPSAQTHVIDHMEAAPNKSAPTDGALVGNFSNESVASPHLVHLALTASSRSDLLVRLDDAEEVSNGTSSPISQPKPHAARVASLPSGSTLSGGFDYHKEPFPLDWRHDGLTILLASLGLVVAASGGIGGGGILVPLFMLALEFKPKHAIALSNFTILGGAIANTLANIRRKHPHREGPIIDWDLILAMEPLTIFGAVFGSLLSKILPNFVLTTMLVIILAMIGQRTLTKGWSMFREESRTLHRAGMELEMSPRATLAEPEDIQDYMAFQSDSESAGAGPAGRGRSTGSPGSSRNADDLLWFPY
eukprot:s324_g8.t1